MDLPQAFTEVELNSMKVKELRDLCRRRKLAIHGRKDLIVRRIMRDQSLIGQSNAGSRGSRSTVETPTKKQKVEFQLSPTVPKSRQCLKCKESLSNDVRLLVGATDYHCYSCKLRDLSPVDAVVDEIMPATKLNDLKFKRMFVVPLSTRYDIEEAKGKLQIQIRCMKVGQKLQGWPANCMILINDRVIFDRSEYEGEDYPLNVTSLLHIGENFIQIHCERQEHILGIYLVKRQDVTFLLSEALRKGNPSSLISWRLQRERSIAIDLTCPITRSKVIWPARSEECTHLECFDLKAFFQRLLKHPEQGLQCPLCFMPVLKPQLDSCLLKLIASAPSRALEIKIGASEFNAVINSFNEAAGVVKVEYEETRGDEVFIEIED